MLRCVSSERCLLTLFHDFQFSKMCSGALPSVKTRDEDPLSQGSQTRTLTSALYSTLNSTFSSGKKEKKNLGDAIERLRA